MNSTPPPTRASSRPSKSVSEGGAPGTAHLRREALRGDKLAQPLLDRQLEVLDDQAPVYVLPVRLDHGIGRKWRVAGQRREGDHEPIASPPRLAHGASPARATRPSRRSGKRAPAPQRERCF